MAVAQLSPMPLPSAALCPLEPPRLLIAAPGAQLQQQPSLASSSALGEPCLTTVLSLHARTACCSLGSLCNDVSSDAEPDTELPPQASLCPIGSFRLKGPWRHGALLP